MAMQLYATKPQAFADDADYVATQTLNAEKRGTFKLRQARTIRIQAVAVDSNGDRVAPTGSFTATVIEAIDRREPSDKPGAHGRQPYLALANKTGTVNLGTAFEIALQPGTYALRFTGAATIPAGAASVRIYLEKDGS